MYLFVPALVQPRPTGIGGKRFFTKAKSQRVTAPIRSSSRAILGTLLGSLSLRIPHQQAAEAQPRHRARVWRHRALPDRRRSRAHRAALLEGRLAADHPVGWRNLRHAETRGQASAGASYLAGSLQRLMVVSARGQPARHYALAPRALTSPSLCLAGLIGSRSGWSRQRRRDLPSLYCVLITHAWRAQVDVLRGSHRANLALEPTAFH